ncbi:putative ABC transporter [Fimicolochytrium jonesii]|uniref:putative ABC transporter n=1 Tax=Fimicolochytrium jonesii TaxID=1396493 RepID=UPI0022FE21EC|nr:putative ABC transporter [Fimicolochytrium jonesii]KAI8816711.1 putative ABC transporter [Fimicolochytrium jonesii]
MVQTKVTTFKALSLVFLLAKLPWAVAKPSDAALRVATWPKPPPGPECLNFGSKRKNCTCEPQIGFPLDKVLGTLDDDYSCNCPVGFGGRTCGEPLCDSLASGPNRSPRPSDKASCDCTDGWTGINCNICMRDDACTTLNPPRDPEFPVPGTPEQDLPVCYSGIRPATGTNYLQCEVRNKRILDMLNGPKPEITYSCSGPESTCNFQFWVDEKESFYCDMSECNSKQVYVDDKLHTTIECGKMHCSCYPNRLLCGDTDGHGFDLTEWFQSTDEGPVGPGALVCEEGSARPGELPERNCHFTENHMNDLISTVFGDPNIQLACPLAGECMYASQLPPDPARKESRSSTLLIVLMSVAGGLLTVFVFGLIWWVRLQKDADIGGAYDAILDQEESDQGSGGRRATLMEHHVPTDLMFRDITYTIDRAQMSSSRRWGRRRTTGLQLPSESQVTVLDKVQGIVKAGEVMAVMGASGAGKSTFLDILAKRNKSGYVSGEMLVNGKFMSDDEYRAIVGYVDQEDTLMPTQTVFEAVLFSALLRLPRHLSYDAKKARVMETLMELDILHIANRRIGTTGERGISGGEKRRVSIACELVTGPRVLFLDEPTSGLDSFNAYNVIECLVNLARTYHRTVILTIHQPRSNIFALFDKLVLLAKGRVVYSGPAQDGCREWFDDLGFRCPLGFNIADYLVDLTMHIANEPDPSSSTPGEPEDEIVVPVNGSSPSTTRPSLGRRQSTVRLRQEAQLFTPQNPQVKIEQASPTASSPGTFGEKMNGSAHHKNKGETNSASRSDEHDEESDPDVSRVSSHHNEELKPLLPIPDDGGNSTNGYLGFPSRAAIASKRASMTPEHIPQQLRALVEGYRASPIAKSTSDAIDEAITHARGDPANTSGLAPGFSEASLADHMTRFFNASHGSRGKRHNGASAATQFLILSQRTLKNLYRNPYLLLTHYALSVVVAINLGLLYWKMDTTMSGFQNRMGVLFFICAVFGFGCLSSMMVFASERVLFVRERAGGYYGPAPYFAAKVLFDIVPLRVIPPILLSLISYYMMGLRSETLAYFLRFVLVLVLFNATAAAMCLAISVVVADSAVALLLANVLMLYEMLFGGMLLNRDGLGWFGKLGIDLSFFHSAWEALMVNEVNGLTLVEKSKGLNIRAPGAFVLRMFGLDPDAYWTDVIRLIIMLSALLIAALAWLSLAVKERR